MELCHDVRTIHSTFMIYSNPSRLKSRNKFQSATAVCGSRTRLLDNVKEIGEGTGAVPNDSSSLTSNR